MDQDYYNKEKVLEIEIENILKILKILNIESTLTKIVFKCCPSNISGHFFNLL